MVIASFLDFYKANIRVKGKDKPSSVMPLKTSEPGEYGNKQYKLLDSESAIFLFEFS